MDTLVAIPCMETMDSMFVQCLVNLRGEFDVKLVPGSLVYHARDMLAEHAITHGYKQVLWLDSDMYFQGDLLERLMAHDKEVVCGLYCRRKPAHYPCLFRLENGKYCDLSDFSRDEAFLIDACGFGAILTKTSALEKVRSTGNMFEPMENLGEDVSWCKRAQSQGVELWCDPTIEVGHIGKQVFGVADFDKWHKEIKKLKEMTQGVESWKE